MLIEQVEYTCMMCCEDATRKLHTEKDEGFFILCGKESCEKELMEQLRSK